MAGVLLPRPSLLCARKLWESCMGFALISVSYAAYIVLPLEQAAVTDADLLPCHLQFFKLAAEQQKHGSDRKTQGTEDQQGSAAESLQYRAGKYRSDRDHAL